MDAFKHALTKRYPNASWTRYLHLHSSWIKVTPSSTVTLHYWRGTTSIWLSGDAFIIIIICQSVIKMRCGWLSGEAAELWYSSEDFAQLRQQACVAVTTGASCQQLTHTVVLIYTTFTVK